MRSLWRTLDTRALWDVLTAFVSSVVMGASFGAIAVTSGMSLWLTMIMSALVFAVGSQFTAVGVIAAGAGPLAAALAGILVNARLLPFGLAVGGFFRGGMPNKLFGSYLMLDQSVAFALAQRDPVKAWAVYRASGIAAFLGLNLGTLTGALVGKSIGDPAIFGLDAVFPAAMLAVILPQLLDVIPRRVAVVGGLIALATAPLLPAGLPVLLGLLGVVAALSLPKWGSKK